MATTTELIARAAAVYLASAPAKGEIEAAVERVDTGGITVSNAIVEILSSGGRDSGPADELAKVFFLLFGRAPDALTYNAGMEFLRSGGTLAEVCKVGLTLNGVNLSNALNLSDSDFVNRLADSMWAVKPGGFSVSPYVSMLSAGTLSRAELLTAAANYTDGFLSYAKKIQPSLAYIACANRQATEEELLLFANSPALPLVRQALTQAGEDPFGQFPYWTVGGPTIYIEGKYANPLSINLQNQTATLGDDAAFSLIITRDGGLSESPIQFQGALLNDVTRLDARGFAEANGKMTLTADSKASTIYAGAITTEMIGGIGDDRLVGNSEADKLHGVDGSDTLTGGAGADTFTLNDNRKYSASELTTITDFGVGSDVLDFSKLLGTQAETPAGINVISGVSDPTATSAINLSLLTRNGVAVIEHNGVWPSAVVGISITSGTLTARTQEQVSHLFTNVTFATAPERSARNILITTDPENGGDIWLIENFTNLATIELAEIQKVGHIDTTADLFSLLSTGGTILA